MCCHPIAFPTIPRSQGWRRCRSWPGEPALFRPFLASSKELGGFTGNANVDSGSRLPRTSFSNSSLSSHTTSMASTFMPPSVWDSLPSSGLANSPGNRGVVHPLPGFISLDNISNSQHRDLPSFYPHQRQRWQRTSMSTWPHQHHPYALSLPFTASSGNAQPRQIHQHSHAHSAAHSRGSTSSIESTNTSFELGFPPPVFRPLPAQGSCCLRQSTRPLQG